MMALSYSDTISLMPSEDRRDALSRAVSRATGTEPPEDPVEGLFATRDVAEAVATKLRRVFPDGRVTIEDERPHLAVVGSGVERRRRVRLRVARNPSGSGG